MATLPKNKLDLLKSALIADDEIEGILVAHVADGHGYRITIESSSAD